MREGAGEVCGEAGSAADALEPIRRLAPDVVVLSVSLGAEEGWGLLRSLSGDGEVPVLVLSSRRDPFYVERALGAGALGYVLEQDSVGAFLDGVRSVSGGRRFVSESVHRPARGREPRGRRSNAAEPSSVLTDRQLQVFRLLGEGRTTRQVAKQLNLSVKTVETHRANIMRSLGVHSAPELIYRAVAWLSSGPTR